MYVCISDLFRLFYMFKLLISKTTWYLIRFVKRKKKQQKK